MHRLSLLSLLGLSALVGCSDDGNHDHGNENELITTVALRFAPQGGGTPLVFEFDDPDGDGGEPPVVDAIELAPGVYATTVTFENRLEEPAEDITEEVRDEADEHQIFFTGSAVDGPAASHPGAPLAHAYADQDASGLPIGLTNTMTATSGAGQLTLTLRHVPPLHDAAVKVAELASQVRDDGFASIGGTTDAQVSFEVSVQ